MAEISLTKITSADLMNKGVTGLPDEPGLPVDEMQRKFDELSLDVLVPSFNRLCDETGEGFNTVRQEASANKSAVETEFRAADSTINTRITNVDTALNNKIDGVDTRLTGSIASARSEATSQVNAAERRLEQEIADLDITSKLEEIEALATEATVASQEAKEAAKRAEQATPEGYEKISLMVRTNELAYLGWSVPYEMPIQNYIDANRVFHQRVGRIALDTLNWTLSWGNKAWYTDQIKDGKAVASGSVANIYNSKYRATVTNDVVNGVNGSIAYWISGANKLVGVANGSTTEKPSGYLYYELATEITFNADGNEKITLLEKHFEVNNFSVPHENLNLLVPALATTIVNGVTCTRVGDEYVLNGTASAMAQFNIGSVTIDSETHTIYGCAKDGSTSTYYLALQTNLNGTPNWLIDTGNGASGKRDSGTVNCRIIIASGYTCNNLVFKPTLIKGTEKPQSIGWENSSALVDKALGKNLIPFPYYEGMSKTSNGITFTVNADGSITANGTATSTAPRFYLFSVNNIFALEKGVAYTLNSGKKENTNVGVELAYYNGGTYAGKVVRSINEPLTFTTFGAEELNYDRFTLYIYVNVGQTLNNLVFKPMLVKGTVAPTEYEKWQGLTSVDVEKYTKYAKIETDKYGSDFIPQYVDYLPNGFCFTDAEQDDLSLLENGVHFLDDGILLLAESTPSTDVNLRIGGVL